MRLEMKFCIMKSKGVIAPYIMGDIAQALENIGHEVLLIDMIELGLYSKDSSRDLIAEDTIQRIRDYNPDMALSYGCGGLINIGEESSTHLFEYLKIPYTLLFYDGPLDNETFFSKYASSDLLNIICWDRSYLDWIKSFGIEKVSYMPLATNPQRFTYRGESVNKDITFVGSLDIPDNKEFSGSDGLSTIQQFFIQLKLHTPCKPFTEIIETSVSSLDENSQKSFIAFQQSPSYRNFIFDTMHISDNQYRKAAVNRASQTAELTLYGSDIWTKHISRNINFNGRIGYLNDLSRIYSTSRINLNLTQCHLISAVNQRIFDASASGGFVLSDYRNDMSDLFELGKETDCFHDLDEMENKLRYYLENSEKRIQMAKEARKKVVAKHTWDIRMKEFTDNYSL